MPHPPLVLIRDAVYEGRWSTARAAASHDPVALAYIREAASRTPSHARARFWDWIGRLGDGDGFGTYSGDGEGCGDGFGWDNGDGNSDGSLYTTSADYDDGDGLGDGFDGALLTEPHGDARGDGGGAGGTPKTLAAIGGDGPYHDDD